MARIDPISRSDPEEVLNAPPLRIRYVPGRSRRLVVSLAGVGRVRGEEPPPEFFRIAGGDGENHVLFVSDRSRSWLNAPGMAEAIVTTVRAVAGRIEADQVVALGNSMGGTMALHLAHLTPFDVVVALVPQYSADPAVVPLETRWRYFRRQIAGFPFRALSRLPATGAVYILHGGTEDELVHALRFPRARNVAHFILPRHDHNLARSLHEAGHLAPLIGHAMAGRRRRVWQAVEALGGMRRRAFEAARAVDLLGPGQHQAGVQA